MENERETIIRILRNRFGWTSAESFKGWTLKELSRLVLEELYWDKFHRTNPPDEKW